MKISNSKKELAKIISENGGWRDGAEWASQDKLYCGKDAVINFYEKEKPWFNGGTFWRGNGVGDSGICCGMLIKNWHQDILSREEYLHLYPVTDADGWIECNGCDPQIDQDAVVEVKFRDGQLGHNPETVRVWCWTHGECDDDIIAYRLHRSENNDLTQVDDIDVVELRSDKQKSTAAGDDETSLAAKEELEAIELSKPKEQCAFLTMSCNPSIEMLADYYRNKLAYAGRKQDEADKAKLESDAALSELEKAIAAIGFAITPIGAAAQEPEMVITDWRDLMVGDIVEISGSKNERWLRFKGVELFVSRTGTAECSLVFRTHDGDEWGHGGNTHWRFIRRPAK